MTRKQSLIYAVLAASALAGGLFATVSNSTENKNISTLAKETHFHGISVDVADPSRLYLATHHGVFAVDAGGKARLISQNRDDFMGFTPHPIDPVVLFASGHPATGGNLGFIASHDGGRTWRKLSDGIGGPVDFHQMDVAKADPEVVYGVHGGIQKSVDAGKSWTLIGPAPTGLINLSVGRASDTVYAATQTGLVLSTDSGKTWKPAHASRQPVTMVHVSKDGTLYAFIVGVGFILADEKDLQWRVAGPGPRNGYLLHLSASSADAHRLYGVTMNPSDRVQSVVTSADEGKSWTALGRE